MGPFGGVALVLLVVAAAGLQTVEVADDTTPFHVAVVHRHGARSTMVSVNQTNVCPPVTVPGGGCGTLSSEGKDMLFQLGVFLANTYGQDGGLFNGPIHTSYDPVRFVSRSTDVGRTIQSGAAMIAGLFAALEGTPQRAYPVLHNRPTNQDVALLVWDGNPSVVLWMDIAQEQLLTFLNEHTLTLFPNASVLEVMGREVGLLDECTPSDPTKWVPFMCGLDLQDAVNCGLSSGFAHERYPTGVANFNQLTKVLEDYNAYTMWGFDDMKNGGRYQAATGTLGFALAQEIVETAATSASGDPSSSVLLNHYSGHDTTLMPLWMTLGNDSLVNPLFGAAMVFEFYHSPSSSSSRVPWVRARIGAPGQLPDNHTYEFEWYSLYCVNATDGSTYRPSDAAVGCPLADWNAFILQQGPPAAAGGGDASCYFDASKMASVNCTPTDKVGRRNGGDNTVCRNFRSSCINACGTAHAMTAQLDCVPIG